VPDDPLTPQREDSRRQNWPGAPPDGKRSSTFHSHPKGGDSGPSIHDEETYDNVFQTTRVRRHYVLGSKDDSVKVYRFFGGWINNVP
jgi:hypothetical protein